MKVERSESGDVTVLRLEGDMDERGVDSLRTALYECSSDGKFQLVLNLHEVGFVSYMAVGVLVEKLRRLRNFNGDMRLVGVNLYTQRLFRQIGVKNIFQCYDTEGQAVDTYLKAA